MTAKQTVTTIEVPYICSTPKLANRFLPLVKKYLPFIHINYVLTLSNSIENLKDKPLILFHNDISSLESIVSDMFSKGVKLIVVLHDHISTRESMEIAAKRYGYDVFACEYSSKCWVKNVGIHILKELGYIVPSKPDLLDIYDIPDIPDTDDIPDTTINSILDTIGLSKYKRDFESEGLITIDQLDYISAKLLLSKISMTLGEYANLMKKIDNTL